MDTGAALLFDQHALLRLGMGSRQHPVEVHSAWEITRIKDNRFLTRTFVFVDERRYLSSQNIVHRDVYMRCWYPWSGYFVRDRGCRVERVWIVLPEFELLRQPRRTSKSLGYLAFYSCAVHGAYPISECQTASANAIYIGSIISGTEAITDASARLPYPD